MSDPAPASAVFLSYAREDAEAARRIADALRAFGMEVWFDQNELRGGDAWDQKIRKQIRECALFMPIVSRTTEGRPEGYFRREWKMAVDRTHDMAAGVVFIVPVLIDETPAKGAAVPDEFLRYQWTHLPHGVPSTEFVQQIKRLLAAPRRGAAARIEGPAAKAPSEASKRPRRHWPAIAAVATVAAAGAVWLLRPHGNAATSTASPPVPATASAPATAAPAPVNDKSIAVLPFENMSAEKDNDAFFADGIHEDILTKLSLVRALRVVSRTSVMQYRNTTKSVPQIARELGVAYVLEGSVRRAGNKVRVTGQLIRASADEHVWAQAYDRDVTDIFAIQGELAQAIADALQAQLSPAEKSLLENRPTQNTAAYELFLRARSLVAAGGALDRQEAPLEAALQLDPNFAAAWGLLARVHAFAIFNNDDASPERLAKAKAAIDTAVRLAPADPGVIESEGDFWYYAYRDYGRAQQFYRRLLQLRPNDGGVRRALALIDRRQHRFREARDGLKLAVELDPQDENATGALLECNLASRRFDEADRDAAQAVGRFPENPFICAMPSAIAFDRDGSRAEADRFRVRAFSAEQQASFEYGVRTSYLMIGDWDEALRRFRAHPYLDVSGETHWSQTAELAVLLHQTGQKEEARRLAEACLVEMGLEATRQPDSPVLWECFAAAYSLLGRHPEALRCADRAVALVPESRDAVQGPTYAAERAAALAWAGRTAEALAEIARLLRTPFGLNVHGPNLTAFPPISFQPLWGDPRLQALREDPRNNAPLF